MGTTNSGQNCAETMHRSKVLKLNAHREAMERSPMEMGVDDARGFLLSAYNCSVSQPL